MQEIIGSRQRSSNWMQLLEATLLDATLLDAESNNWMQLLEAATGCSDWMQRLDVATGCSSTEITYKYGNVRILDFLAAVQLFLEERLSGLSSDGLLGAPLSFQFSKIKFLCGSLRWF